MLSAAENANERRSQSHDLISDLVSTRTEMLTLYSKLAAKRPFTDEEAVAELLQEFCEIMVDYTASAHFRLYRFLDEKIERRRGVLRIAEVIYPRVIDTTQAIVDFNDRYDGTNSAYDADGLAQDLSWLGERLAERIELEDQLIEVLTAPRRKILREQELDS